MITEIGTRQDGTTLGEDESGNLFSGVWVEVGYDELDRVITVDGDNTLVEFVYKGEVYSKALLHTVTLDEITAWQAATAEAKANGTPLPVPLSGYFPESAPGPKAEKQYATAMVFDAEGKRSYVNVEMKIDVCDWSPL